MERNTYTQELANCLDHLENREMSSLDSHTYMRLTNLIQGRMLQHLVHRIADFYQINDVEFQTEISTLLVEVFADDLFASFRAKIEARPHLSVDLAHRIVNCEIHTAHQDESLRLVSINQMFLSIFYKYLQIKVNYVTRRLRSEPRIQKLVLSYLLKKHCTCLSPHSIENLLEQDSYHLLTHLFILYGNFASTWRKLNKFEVRFRSYL